METDVPYMPSVRNLPKILDAMQRAGVPEVFGLDFLVSLGFTSSNDRPILRVLKYLGFLDSAGRPQTAYREFMDQSRARVVLAQRLRAAFDDLFLSDREAHNKSSEALKGWFKTKTGASDSVAEKIASTFRSLASYADFDTRAEPQATSVTDEPISKDKPERTVAFEGSRPLGQVGLVYRFEIHLPDTQNVDTFRAIFRALREELVQ